MSQAFTGGVVIAKKFRIALEPGEGVAVYVSGETVRYRSMKKETAAEIVTAMKKDGEL